MNPRGRMRVQPCRFLDMEEQNESWTPKSTNRYSEFRQATRRHAPSALIPYIAAVAATHAYETMKQWQKGLHPWVFAAIARDCMLYSDEFRDKPVGEVALHRMHNLFTNAYDRDSGPTSDLLSMMLGYAYEQTWYQRSDKHELARSYLLYTQTQVESRYEFPNKDDWEEYLKIPLKDAMKASFALFALACSHMGSFDPTYPGSKRYVELEPHVPAIHLRTTLDLLTTTIPQAKERSRDVIELPPSLHRFAFNPLIERPFVDLDGGLRYSPQPKFILRSMAAENLYYRGIKHWGTRFGQSFGARVEAYTGLQLRHTGQHHVIPEFQWHKPRVGVMRSSDWFLDTPDALILIECKSARMTLEAKAGTGSAEELLERYVGRAYQQLSANADEIIAQNPAFDHIPANKPLIGLVVTAEPMFGANAESMRKRFGSESIAVLTASLEEVEMISSLTPKLVGETLLKIVDNPRLNSGGLKEAFLSLLGDTVNVPNRLIQETFAELMPIQDPPTSSS